MKNVDRRIITKRSLKGDERIEEVHAEGMIAEEKVEGEERKASCLNRGKNKGERGEISRRNIIEKNRAARDGVKRERGKGPLHRN